MTKNPIVQWFRNKWDAILWLMFLIFFSYLFTWPLYVHAHVPWTVATLREEGAIQVEAKVIDLADWGPLGCRVLNQYTVARQTFTFWGGGGGGRISMVARPVVTGLDRPTPSSSLLTTLASLWVTVVFLRA